MRITSKGQVTIPLAVRQATGLLPNCEVEFEVRGKKVIKCDQCDGDPTCVKYCEPKALDWVDATDVNIRKQREAAAKGHELKRDQKEAIGPESGHPGDFWPGGYKAWHQEAYIPRKPAKKST